jgi:hypothetical protein
MIHKFPCAGPPFLFALFLAFILAAGCDQATRTEVDAQVQSLDAKQEELRAELHAIQENLQQLELILEGVTALREENEKIQTQMDGLRENFDQFSERFQTSIVQRLPPATAPAPPRPIARTPPPPPSAPAIAPDEEPENNIAYWISLPAGVRHNQGCAYFKRTRGKLGAATEGIPCRVCGG